LSLPRVYGKIHQERRIAIPKHILELLGWKIGDQIIVEAYQGKLIVENLSKTIKPIEERIS